MKVTDYLRTATDGFAITLDNDALRRFEIYYNLLAEWNEKINLTAITDPQGVAVKHFADSLAFFNYITVPKDAKIIDVGTGAGFPGVVLKIARPDIKLTLLDSLNKRFLFLRDLTEKLGLDADFAPMAYNLGGILFRPGYCIVFTACSLFTADLYGIEVTWVWLLAAFLLSFILSVATPPVVGGTTVCFSILFSQLGIKADALAVIISVNAVFEFLTVAVNNYCLQSQIVLLGNRFGKLDHERLRAS